VRRICPMPSTARFPLSLVSFVSTKQIAGPLMARIVVRGTKDSSRQMKVLWDGQALGTFDVAGYFDEDKAFFVEIPGPQRAGLGELRVAGGDSGAILVRQISVAGAGVVAWAEKAALPAGGTLDVLSAYYMPDSEPSPASQAVEGRHKTQEVGGILEHLQRMYKKHADFGGVRVIVRNNGKVPVRLGELWLNGHPVEASYVDFAHSDWDARGVV